MVHVEASPAMSEPVLLGSDHAAVKTKLESPKTSNPTHSKLEPQASRAETEDQSDEQYTASVHSNASTTPAAQIDTAHGAASQESPPKSPGSPVNSTNSINPPPSLSRNDEVMEYIKSLEDRIRRMEEANKDADVSAKDGGAPNADSSDGQVPKVEISGAATESRGTRVEKPDGPSDGENEKKSSQENHSSPPELVAKVRWCNWEEFKNRFSPDEGRHAVEVLYGSKYMIPEQRQEMARRYAAEERNRRRPSGVSSASSRNVQLLSDVQEAVQVKGVQGRDARIVRVRIQSKVVLRTLAKVSRKSGIYPLDEDTPTTYPRPFKPLIHFHQSVKEELATLEKIYQEKDGSDEANKPTDNPEQTSLENQGKVNADTDAIKGAHQGVSTEQEVMEKSPVGGPDVTPALPSKATVPATEAESGQSQADAGTEPGAMSGGEDDPASEAVAREKHTMEPTSSETASSLARELAELRCYVDFIDKDIMPLFLQLRSEKISDDCPRKVYNEDLWYLFRPDDLVFVPGPSRASSSRFPETPQLIWRAFDLLTTKPSWKVDRIAKEHQRSRGKKAGSQPPEGEGISVEDDDDSGDDPKATSISCYCLDYTGSTFCPVTANFVIPNFEGQVDITSLVVYPLRFHQQRDELVRDMLARRSFIQDYVRGHQHLAHTGWSRVYDRLGLPLDEDPNPDVKPSQKVPRAPEYIDSEVIIDFEEAFQNQPAWRPPFVWSTNFPQVEGKWATDSFPIIEWSDRSRGSVVSRSYEICEDGSDIVNLETIDVVKRDRFFTMSAATTAYTTEGPPQHDKIEGDDVLLLPTRLFAYALRERRFIQVDVQYLRRMQDVVEPFKSLNIERDHKSMIQGLLHSHFSARKLQSETGGGDLPSQDLIRGKGRGVVILLHGVPGVGKTATAEAVAQHYGKPLFAITCADLGLSAEAVEDRLSEIFRLSNLWDCILLLDEADVFLSQREPNDLARNALVSVILRILEYHKGVLFLTTNRDGRLDEAVKSRVHVSLHYPPLSRGQTLDIFRLNMERLEMIETQRAERSGERKLAILREDIMEWAAEHFDRHQRAGGMGSWNGRQIRNAFQIASSLAHYDKLQNGLLEAHLRKDHFETVAKAILRYDQFRASTKGRTEREWAKERGERDDAFVTGAGFMRAVGQDWGGGGMGGPSSTPQQQQEQQQQQQQYQPQSMYSSPDPRQAPMSTYQSQAGPYRPHGY